MGDLLLQHGELPAKRDERGIDGIVFHVLLDLIQRKAHFLHDENGIQIVDLLGGIVAVAVFGIDIGGEEQPDLIVIDERLLGDILIFCKLSDGEKILHKIPLDNIVTISFIIVSLS